MSSTNLNEIKLLKNNDKREDTDLEWVTEFYEFLQGNIPEKITLGRGHNPKLSKKKAFAIIWYLQEHFPVFTDRIEKCSVCDDLYDGWSGGHYSEKQGKHYCGSCDTEHNFED